MKTCLNCGKELTTEQRHNTYCSIGCQHEYQKNQRINQWLTGNFNATTSSGELSDTIRKYLLEKSNYACELCGWNKKNPITNMVPLEIHHIDGNYLHNNPENLQVLCPNCHALTPNYKKLNESKRERGIRRKSFCKDCGVEINSGSLRCPACAAKARITEKPVTREELKDLIRTTPFTTIGNHFGVDGNAIKKWCIRYGLPSKKKDIKLYSDEEWASI